MKNLAPTPADALIAALHEPGRENLLDLVQNPLCLTMLCMIWDGSLPDTQAELYQRYLRKIYEWNQNLNDLEKYAEVCGTNTTKLKQNLNRQLGELAKAALNLPRQRFRLSQALVEEHLGEESDQTSWAYLVLRLGWLNRVGRDGRGDSIFAFYHATFQEYFAALAVEDWDYFLPRNHVDSPVAGRRYRIFEKQWKQVILCWLGRKEIQAQKKEEFIRALVEFEDGVRDFYEYKTYLLAAAEINQFKTCSLATDIVRQVVKWGFGYFNTEKQEWQTFLEPIEEAAREVIPQTIRPLAMSALIELIENCPEKDSRMQAAETLGKIDPGNPKAIAVLLEIIRTTENEWARWRVADSLGKIDPGNPDAIAVLLEIIRTTENENTRYQAAFSLGEIDPGNPDAIAGLLEIIRTTEDKLTRWRAAWSLEEIGQGNPDAIAGLLEIIRTTEDEDTRRRAAYSLEEIGVGNPDAIAGLLQVIRTTENEYTRIQAAESLWKIGQGNPDAIAGLLQVIRTTENEYTRIQAAESLWKIGQGNPDAIAGLLQVIRTTENEYTRIQAAESLWKIGQGNPDAIAVLVEIIRTTEDKYTRYQAVESLGKIGQGNPDAIAGLLEIIRTTENEKTRREAVESLGKIGQGNPDAIAGLLQVIRTTEDKLTRWRAAWSLEEIGQGNPDAIAGLVEIIRTTENESTRSLAVDSLEEIDPGNPEAIAGLLEIIRTTEDEDIRRLAAWSLGKILATPEEYAGVVSALKDCLSDEVYENNFDLFKASYKLICNCAENLPYPEFYQPWHNLPTTPHPEVEDNTPFIQQCNLALVPQILNQAIQTHPVNCQAICIDGSRFSDPSNPALQIYTTLKKAGCPPSPDGKPRTIAELQAYCEDDLSDHPIALILYEEPTDPPPQGFDIAVLNKLARFSHPPMAVIVPQRLPECRLPQFLESDPDLIAHLFQWLQNLAR
ncbi:PBS lyase HEAT domain protein repeat-containing protein [Arthrospira platensis C1]|nr:PBS lyase HEAT domain protein repeat-containing protein [Arthrospira platensis C1]